MKNEILNNIICYNWFGVIADHCLDFPDSEYVPIGVTKLHQKTLNPEKVKEGDIVFVKTDYVYHGFFQNSILPRISQPFILITGGSSYQVSQGHPIDGILNNPLVKKWYCTNAPIGISEKIIPLPIGFQERERKGGNQELIKKCQLEKTSFNNKKNKVFLPYHTLGTNPQRERLFAYLSSLPFVETQHAPLGWLEYMQALDKYKFTICLEGSGPDVHRNYESLLINSVPININNPIKSLFDHHDLCGLFLNSWEELTEEYFKALCERDFKFENSDNFLNIAYHSQKINADRGVSG